MAKIFFKLDYQVYAVCKYESLNLKKYCSKIICVNFKEIKTINNFIKENYKPNLTEILIGSGYSERLSDKLMDFKLINRGNDLNTHNQINSINFFEILEKNKVKIPEFSFENPRTKKWLIKNVKSFGGYKIYNFKTKRKLKKFEFFQKKITGEHLSVQFFCKKKDLKILSVCNQYFCKKEKPFIIESLISKNIKTKIMRKIYNLCKRIRDLFNLNGFNNLDIVLEENSNFIYLIELNGRPGLSTNLVYKLNPNIFKKSFDLNKSKKSTFFYGTKIIYSDKRICISKKNFKFIKSFEKNKTFSELPIKNEIIKKGEPICLIHLKSKKNQILRENLNKISYKFIKGLS